MSEKSADPSVTLPVEALEDLGRSCERCLALAERAEADCEKGKAQFAAQDSRFTTFAKLGQVFRSSWLGLMHVHEDMGRADFWEGRWPPRSEAPDRSEHFVSMLKLALLTLAQAQLESALRLLFVALKIPSKAPGLTLEWSSLYSQLLAELELTKHVPTLKLMGLLRNASYNQGIFLSLQKMRPPEFVTFQGKQHTFRHGEKIDGSLPLVLDVLEDMLTTFEEVVAHERVQALTPASVLDPTG